MTSWIFPPFIFSSFLFLRKQITKFYKEYKKQSIMMQNMAIHLREPEVDDGLIGDEEYDLHEEYSWNEYTTH